MPVVEHHAADRTTNTGKGVHPQLRFADAANVGALPAQVAADKGGNVWQDDTGEVKLADGAGGWRSHMFAPAGSVDNEMAHYNGTVGNLLKVATDYSYVVATRTAQIYQNAGGAVIPTFILDNDKPTNGVAGIAEYIVKNQNAAYAFRISDIGSLQIRRGATTYLEHTTALAWSMTGNLGLGVAAPNYPLILEGGAGLSGVIAKLRGVNAAASTLVYVANGAAASTLAAVDIEGRLSTSVGERSATRIRSRFTNTTDATRRGILEMFAAASDTGAGFSARGGFDGENFWFGGLTTSNWNALRGGAYIRNAVAVPTGNPTAGGYLYTEAGALKYRGSGGTITTLGAA